VAGIQFRDWTHPLIVLGLAVVVKLLEDLVISPKIIGGRVGLRPLTIILAVMIGTTLLGGFLGALLAIPLTAALRTLMFRYVWTREHAIGKPAEAEAATELAK
jgi:predicted PurR-regulated permease PerM